MNDNRFWVGLLAIALYAVILLTITWLTINGLINYPN